MGQNSCQPARGCSQNRRRAGAWSRGPGFRGCDRVGACKSRALRRSHVPLRGAGGTWSRGPARGDATVEPAVSASCPALCASPGSDPQRGGCRGGAGAPTLSWGCDPRSDAWGPPAALDRLRGQIPEKNFGAPLPLSGGPSSALRRAIQAHDAWNLLRPARDTLSLGLPISTYWLHLASRHHQFWQQRTRVSWCYRLFGRRPSFANSARSCSTSGLPVVSSFSP